MLTFATSAVFVVERVRFGSDGFGVTVSSMVCVAEDMLDGIPSDAGVYWCVEEDMPSCEAANVFAMPSPDWTSVRDVNGVSVRVVCSMVFVLFAVEADV